MPNVFFDEDAELAAEVERQFDVLKLANGLEDLPGVVGVVAIILADDGSQDARISPAIAALARIASSVTDMEHTL